METLISVCVPRRGGGRRDELWSWCEARWRALLPEAEISTADSEGEQFHHTQAANRAVAASSGDVLVLTEADTTFDPAWIRQAVALVESGVPWVLPRTYHQLTRSDTDRIVAGPPVAPVEHGRTEWSGTTSWAGLVVVPRAAFDGVGGYDERIEGWGPMDGCLGLALDTLHGPHTRLDGCAWHLWHEVTHPPACGSDIYGQYRSAVGSATQMREAVTR